MSWGMLTREQLEALKKKHPHKEPSIMVHEEFCEQVKLMKLRTQADPEHPEVFDIAYRLVQHNRTLDKKAALVPLLLEEIRQAIITLGVSGNNTEAARLMMRMKELTGDDQSGFKFNAPIKT